MYEGSACQPWHEGRDLHRVPTPVATPAEYIISPAPAEYESEGQEQPRPQCPAAREANPAIIGAACNQRGHCERVRNDERDEAKIKHRGMDDHARVAKKRIQSPAILRSKKNALCGLECVCGDPVEVLIQLGEWILEEDVHSNKERHRDAGNSDDPGQELTVAVPFAQGNKRREG